MMVNNSLTFWQQLIIAIIPALVLAVTVLFSIKIHRSQKLNEKKIEAFTEYLSNIQLLEYELRQRCFIFEDFKIDSSKSNAIEELKEWDKKYSAVSYSLNERYALISLFISKSGRNKYKKFWDSLYTIDMDTPNERDSDTTIDLYIKELKKQRNSLIKFNNEITKLFKRELGLK